MNNFSQLFTFFGSNMLAVLILVPGAFWGAYHYYKDRHRPEPVALLLFALLLGVGAAYIGLGLYSLLDSIGFKSDAYSLMHDRNITGLFWYCIFVIGPIEELAKLIPFLLILIWLPHFDEPFDGVIYASFVALGFALHENLSYLPFMEGPEAVGRAFASPMVHILFASVWGYAYGYADEHNCHRGLATFLGFILSAVLHGFYDFFAIYISVWTHIAPPLVILALWMWRRWATRHCTSGEHTLWIKR